MKKKSPSLILLLVLLTIGAGGKIAAIAQTSPPRPPVVESMMVIEDVSVKTDDGDAAEDAKEIEAAEVKKEEEYSSKIKILDEREKAVVEKEFQIKALEARVDMKVNELKNIKGQLEVAVGAIGGRKKEDVLKLSDMFSKMKPKSAAERLNIMPVNDVVEILDGMKNVQASGIMSLIDPAKAREITTFILKRSDRIIAE